MFRKKTMSSEKTGSDLTKNQERKEMLQSIQELSCKNQDHKPLVTVPERGIFFGLGIHKVTGKELNTALSQIDDELIRTKELNTAVLNHISALYQAIDALDDAHISGIMTAANVAKAADDKANINGQNIEKVVRLLTDTPYYIKQKNEFEKALGTMEKKVKTAYYIAAGSIVLAIITLMLSVSGIL